MKLVDQELKINISSLYHYLSLPSAFSLSMGAGTEQVEGQSKGKRISEEQFLSWKRQKVSSSSLKIIHGKKELMLRRRRMKMREKRNDRGQEDTVYESAGCESRVLDTRSHLIIV